MLFRSKLAVARQGRFLARVKGAYSVGAKLGAPATVTDTFLEPTSVTGNAAIAVALQESTEDTAKLILVDGIIEQAQSQLMQLAVRFVGKDALRCGYVGFEDGDIWVAKPPHLREGYLMGNLSSGDSTEWLPIMSYGAALTGGAGDYRLFARIPYQGLGIYNSDVGSKREVWICDRNNLPDPQAPGTPHFWQVISPHYFDPGQVNVDELAASGWIWGGWTEEPSVMVALMDQRLSFFVDDNGAFIAYGQIDESVYPALHNVRYIDLNIMARRWEIGRAHV